MGCLELCERYCISCEQQSALLRTHPTPPSHHDVGMAPDEAKRNYVQLLAEDDEDWESHEALKEFSE